MAQVVVVVAATLSVLGLMRVPDLPKVGSNARDMRMNPVAYARLGDRRTWEGVRRAM
jgi:hypothetical protein